ncbi:MAG TPA: hypothetical protein VND80_00960 [Steroidobacteraceae bacterium]|nr:hypothetical protein [Steroidobacteraceae bacterium]
MSEDSPTGTFQLEVPAELLTEAGRVASAAAQQLRVESWRPSWLSRIGELLAGED